MKSQSLGKEYIPKLSSSQSYQQQEIAAIEQIRKTFTEPWCISQG